MLKYNFVFNLSNIIVVFFQIYYDLKFLFIISIMLAVVLIYKYSEFDKIKS